MDKNLGAPNSTSTLLKIVIITIYVVAIISAIICSAYTLLALLFFLVAGGLSNWFFIYPMIPAIVNVVYLLLILRIVGTRTWRKKMFGAKVWVPVLVALPFI